MVPTRSRSCAQPGRGRGLTPAAAGNRRPPRPRHPSGCCRLRPTRRWRTPPLCLPPGRCHHEVGRPLQREESRALQRSDHVDAQRPHSAPLLLRGHCSGFCPCMRVSRGGWVLVLFCVGNYHPHVSANYMELLSGQTEIQLELRKGRSSHHSLSPPAFPCAPEP